MREARHAWEDHMAEQLQDAYTQQTLPNDGGAAVSFYGKLYSETAFYDDDSGTLTRIKMFLTDDGRHVYSFVSGSPAEKSRRAYTLRFEEELCFLGNGVQEIPLSIDMLLDTVFSLCHLDPAEGGAVRTLIEDSRKAVNA